MEYKYKRENREERPNRTGIPDNMKKRFEAFSGEAFDDVRVHYCSREPARLNAHRVKQALKNKFVIRMG